MRVKSHTINGVLSVLLFAAVCGLIAMYQSYSQQHQQIETLRGQLIEKESQIVVSNEALSYRRYQHQLLVEDYDRFRSQQSSNSMIR
ncbi:MULTISPECIES: hypothetical protein [Vibrio]|uniref:hypothetical protein n=1 Tax=Vibrio TaxID=662 RepID=UPI001AF1E736|nr:MULTISPECIES: hypothetical protein [Vibrio]WQE78364.1 hypothetical protein SO574_14535 [Vibrio alfacsensis]BBM66842.1 hypothetical protein VA249_34880 [Vibrio alfacsensis]BCN26216.1 hypothetical protein VYA_34080 [Vibrio alfacsensis]CAE6923700.1 hypothetical protein ACOMICROBIO_GDFFDHBD_02137 [Vibrio sp. B1REV9]